MQGNLSVTIRTASLSNYDFSSTDVLIPDARHVRVYISIPIYITMINVLCPCIVYLYCVIVLYCVFVLCLLLFICILHWLS